MISWQLVIKVIDDSIVIDDFKIIDDSKIVLDFMVVDDCKIFDNGWVDGLWDIFWNLLL